MKQVLKSAKFLYYLNHDKFAFLHMILVEGSVAKEFWHGQWQFWGNYVSFAEALVVWDFLLGRQAHLSDSPRIFLRFLPQKECLDCCGRVNSRVGERRSEQRGALNGTMGGRTIQTPTHTQQRATIGDLLPRTQQAAFIAYNPNLIASPVYLSLRGSRLHDGRA